MRGWRWLGLAGLAGVAATGVLTVRAERERRACTPDEIRERLRERAARAGVPDDRCGRAPTAGSDGPG